MKLFVWDFHGVLEKGNDEAVVELVNRIPGERMSQPCRIFVARLLNENRRRLLDEFDSHYRG